VDAVIGVTHRCNARCLMCNIWREQVRDALDADALRKLPRSLQTVNLSGGEPFLRDDLPELVAAVRDRCRRAIVTLSTNGLASDRILPAMREIGLGEPRVRLAVSVDGLGEVHDRIRGVDGAFERAMQTVDALRYAGCSGLRLSMTVTADNAHQVAAVADLARCRGLELGVVAAQAAEAQLHVASLPSARPGAEARQAFEAVVADWLRTARPKLWLRAHFAAMTWRYLCGERWENFSRPGESLFFVQSDGTVYPSGVGGQPMGNLCEMTWQQVWQGEAARQARRAERSRRQESWMICTARRYYRKRAPGVVGWILSEKIRAHLRRLRLPEVPQAGGEARAHRTH
jgi:MoaA/NifB/PqqE/SkfB family radical SAM enzyme